MEFNIPLPRFNDETFVKNNGETKRINSKFQ